MLLDASLPPPPSRSNRKFLSFRGRDPALPKARGPRIIPPTMTPHFGKYYDGKFLSFRGNPLPQGLYMYPHRPRPPLSVNYDA
jgi:hypothetical protein